MSEPFLCEIKLVCFDFAPRGWALCNGQLLPINQNQALFSLLGTAYGGNGTTNFALPDLRSRVPMHFSSSVPQGARMGSEFVTLNSSQIPSHTHRVNVGSAVATVATASGNIPARVADGVAPRYGAAAGVVAMNAQAVGNAGGNQPHSNLQPLLVMNYIIALQGIFPSRN